MDRVVVPRILTSLQPTSPSSASRRHPGVPSVSSPVSVWVQGFIQDFELGGDNVRAYFFFFGGGGGGGGARSPRENLNLDPFNCF